MDQQLALVADLPQRFVKAGEKPCRIVKKQEKEAVVGKGRLQVFVQ